jgi:hypothetical protein
MTYLIQPSFAAGELSPASYARVDVDRFRAGAKTIKNFIVEKHGGVTNRPGTYFIGEVYDSDYKSRLVPFQFSVTQAYALEFSEKKMRIIKDGGIVVGATSSAIITVATPWSASELDDLDFTQSADVLYVVHPDYFPYKISRTDHDAWTITMMSFDDGPYASNATFDFDSQDIIFQADSHYSNAVTITSPTPVFKATMDEQLIRLGYFDPEDISSIKWKTGRIKTITNSASVVVDFSSSREVLGHVFNDNHRFYQGLAYWEDFSSGGSSVVYAPGIVVQFQQGAPGGGGDIRQKINLPQNIKCVLVGSVSSASSETLCVANFRVGTTSGAEDLGVAQCTGSGTVQISVQVPESTTAGSNNTNIFLTVDSDTSSNSQTFEVAMAAMTSKEINTNQWRVPAWTDDSGYPRVVTFFEQRLIFGSSVEEPQTFWLSKTADFENFGFSSPIAADDSFQFGLSSRQLNDIRWLVPFTDLLAGTSEGEWAISRGENSDAMTPTSINARSQSYLGSADIKPIVIGNSVLFVHRGGNSVHDIQYSLERDAYVPNDLSLIASHLFEGKQIKSWAYSRNPYSVIWCVLDDGILVGMTYVRDSEMWAWHQHETDGTFESVCVVPGDETTDDVYFEVLRTVDETEVRYLEQLMPRITDEDTYDFFFVDSGLSLSTSGAVTTIGGLGHLEGESVAILANGSVMPQQNVSASSVSITLAASASGTNIVHVGLPYTSDLETLDIELSDTLGVSQGRQKTIPRVTISLRKSRGLKVGPDEDNLDELKYRTLADGEDPIALYTGDKTIDIPAGYETQGGLFIRNSDPIPLTILSITPTIELSEA